MSSLRPARAGTRISTFFRRKSRSRRNCLSSGPRRSPSLRARDEPGGGVVPAGGRGDLSGRRSGAGLALQLALDAVERVRGGKPGEQGTGAIERATGLGGIAGGATHHEIRLPELQAL